MFELSYGNCLLLMFILIIISAIIQAQVSLSYKKYSKVISNYGMSASELVKKILLNKNLGHVQVVKNNGSALDNFYDPRNQTISLSSEVYESSSVSALAIACHELGHALQYNSEYTPIVLRNSVILPLCNISSKLLWPIVFIGLFFDLASTSFGSIFMYAGLIFFGVTVLFNLVTMPVEYNASNRSLAILRDMNVLNQDELKGARKVLRLAGLTYLASLLISLLDLLRFVSMFKNDD